MKLLRKKVNYQSKDGKKKSSYNLYLRLDNGMTIPIKNTFKEGYLPLVFVAENYEEK